MNESETIAVSDSLIVPRGQPTEAEFETIRSFGIHNDDIRPEQVFVWDQVASGDGVDFYATRQHKTSLQNFELDFKAGQSVLASHNTGLLSFGSSYDARLVDADPLASYYEKTFFRKWSKPEYATSQVLIGSFFMPRGLELNGQKTDDIIASLKFGNIRKASISFIPDRYVCSLDDQDMLSGWGGPVPAGVVGDDPEACLHFPSVMYEGDLAYAWMHDGTVVEHSLVYKNASPSALLVRKAEQLAEIGAIDKRQIVRLEERLGRSLPPFVPRVFRAAEPGEDDVTDELETELEEQEDTTEDTTVSEHAKGKHDQKDHGNEEDEDEDEDDKKRAVSVRFQMIRTALGVESLDARTLKELRENADLGVQMYSQLVDATVAARVRAAGRERPYPLEAAEKYRRSLQIMRDPEYVMSENELYEGRSPFKPGRQVKPGDPPASGQPSVLPKTYVPIEGGRLVGQLNGGVATKEK